MTHSCILARPPRGVNKQVCQGAPSIVSWGGAGGGQTWQIPCDAPLNIDSQLIQELISYKPPVWSIQPSPIDRLFLECYLCFEKLGLFCASLATKLHREALGLSSCGIGLSKEVLSTIVVQKWQRISVHVKEHAVLQKRSGEQWGKKYCD